MFFSSLLVPLCGFQGKTGYFRTMSNNLKEKKKSKIKVYYVAVADIFGLLRAVEADCDSDCLGR